MANTKVENQRAGLFTRPGHGKLETAEMVDALNKLLANYSVHYQKLRNYHWNVKGQDFFDLHQQFENQYNQAKENSDEIAERIRVFGRTPLSTLRAYLDNSEIRETGSDLTSYEMVKEILNDYEILIEHMLHVVDIAIDHSDSGSERMIKMFIKQLEKHHWMLSAFVEG